MNHTDQQEIQKRIHELTERNEALKKDPFKLNISRGLPSEEQINLSRGLFDISPSDLFFSKDSLDIRNYGVILGIPEARDLFARIMEIKPNQTIVGGNSSMQLMYIVLNMLMYTSDQAWSKTNTNGPVKFLCPSPGYDRHWSMLDRLGIEMITVPLTGQGPDMDYVENLVKNDESIKGIYCVPKYSNPTGEVYSDQTIQRLAQLETKAKDFVVLWDNAYIVHHITDEKIKIKNIHEAAKKANKENRIYEFVSTSKITLPGAGVAAIGTSEENVKNLEMELSNQIISFDKINQKRQVIFLKDLETIESLMEKHADILKPKFDYILSQLNQAFPNNEFVTWTEPKGGYFIHLQTQDGLASKIVSKMDEIGIKLTPANSSYPNGDNPRDNSIRLAPSYATHEELKEAIPALVGIIELVTIESKF